MSKILKITIGIRPYSRMFRVSSLHGILIDEILGARGKGVLDDEYFKGISKNDDQTLVRLINEDEGNFIQIDQENVTFTKDFYVCEESFDWKKCFVEFCYLWKLINKTLKMCDVRRIGIVGEIRYESSEKNIPSQAILGKLTTFPSIAHPAKARVRYEDRRPTVEGVAPDVHKSDYINVIHDIYDGETDADHPSEKFIYSTLDTQRYYSPLLNSDVEKEVEKLFKQFTIEKEKIIKFLDSKGIVSNG